jgi:MFS family permease
VSALPLPRSPRLRRILAAYTVNKLGTWFGTVALSLAIYDRTHSAAAVTALFVARYLPALAVPALVARVEASPRRGRLSFLYGIEAVTTAALAALVWQFWLAAILVLVAVDGAAELTASSLLRAQAARAGEDGARVDGHDAESSERGVYDANAALNVALAVTVVAGPTLAAAAVKAFGGPVALLIDAASFLACGALLVDLYPYIEERAGTSVRARLAAAWEHVREAPALRAVLLTQVAALIFFETAAPVEVFYAKGTLKAGDLGYGALLAVWGVGQLGGSLFFARTARRSLGAMLTLGTLAVGLAYLGFAAAPTLLLAALAALLGGLGNGVQWASLIGTVQLLTPERLRGRLMGGVESIGALCPLIGLPLAGLVMTLSSPRVTFLIFGSITAATTLGFARLWATGLIRAVGTGGSTTPTDVPSPTEVADSRTGGLLRAPTRDPTVRRGGSLSATPYRPLRTTEANHASNDDD